MRLQRISEMAEPPVEGRSYLVPCVRYWWRNRLRLWPVFLSRHEDGDHLDFPYFHYHVDPRFVPPADFAWAGRGGGLRLKNGTEVPAPDAFAFFQVFPMFKHGSRTPGRIQWRRRRCWRGVIPYRFSASIAERLTPVFGGGQCERHALGWLCPHKRFPLGAVVPVDGVIICPMHGLQIDAETGKVVGPVANCEGAA